jgi:hypothetical protein
MSVTATEANTIAPASVSVTVSMFCYNNQLFFTDEGTLRYQRWFAVHLWRDEQGRCFACPDGYKVDEPWRVRIIRCVCGQNFASRGPRIWRCRDCETARRTAAQRGRRAQRRQLPCICVLCLAPMRARRQTRCYCSTRCRVAAARARERNGRTTCPDNPGRTVRGGPDGQHPPFRGCPSGRPASGEVARAAVVKQHGRLA